MPSLINDRNGTSNDETWEMESGTSEPSEHIALIDSLFDPQRNIFGTTADSLSFALATNSYPTTRNGFPFSLPQNFTFVIREGTNHAIAAGTVSHTTPDLLTVLQDVQGNEILSIRKQVLPSFSVECRAFDIRRVNTVHKFDVYKGGRRIGLITFGDGEPTRTCLKIFGADGNSQLVVRSVTKGEFAVFRDQSSIDPLCNIKANNRFEFLTHSFDFSGNITFYPDTGITIEEQQLCTAATFAYKICEVQLKTTREIQIRSTRIWNVVGFILLAMCLYLIYLCNVIIFNQLA
ncbi:uncharacterized protein LOC119078688 [Bradysia coprophila]|uniref:uncharacterized protein LOC119078688 n=1 Tax=Bradysia coprophila TaxID=38358 RepID=UPI00187D968F|nr:uncharacterized protein LOC119078688 [Bradysia coprophila]